MASPNPKSREQNQKDRESKKGYIDNRNSFLIHTKNYNYTPKRENRKG